MSRGWACRGRMQQLRTVYHCGPGTMVRRTDWLIKTRPS